MTAGLHRDTIVQTVKEAADIVEIIGEVVSLKRSGVNLKGLCPFHSEKTPSFIVNPERHSFHCFGCGEGGDVLSFIMKYHNMAFPEALKELAQRYRITLPEKSFDPQDLALAKKRDAVFWANEKAAALFHDFLMHDKTAAPARTYLEGRGIPSEIIREFKLGYAPKSWDFLCKAILKSGLDMDTVFEAGLVVRKDQGGYYDRFRDRVMCPIYSPTGKTVAFGGRILGDGQPKYLNSPETAVFDKSGTLFGFYQNKGKIREKKQCLVVEGNFDLLALVAHGVKNVAAPLGTALTKRHIRQLKGYAEEVVLLFDGDSAGINAAMRTVPLFLTEQVNGKIAVLPADHDPDSFIRQYGADKLLSRIKKSLSLPEFVFEHFVKTHGLSLEGKGRIIEDLRPIAKNISDPAQRQLFASHFSAKLGLAPEQLLFEGPRKTAKTRAPSREKQTGPSMTLPLKQRQLLEFLLCYPQYLASFIDAGLADVIDSPVGHAILKSLQELKNDAKASGAEEILTHLTGPEKSLISEILISAPTYSEEEKEALAEEKIFWLKKISLQNRMERLTKKINEAQQAKNDSLCMELITQKKEMEKILAP